MDFAPLLERATGKQSLDALMNLPQGRAIEQETAAERDRVHGELIIFRRCKIALLIARKEQKYQCKRIDERIAPCEQNLHTFPLNGYWRQELNFVTHKKRMFGQRVAMAKRRVSLARHSANAAMKHVLVEMHIRTTKANVRSIGHVAAFFRAQESVAMGAMHVFEQVVRPRCSTAILAPHSDDYEEGTKSAL